MNIRCIKMKTLYVALIVMTVLLSGCTATPHKKEINDNIKQWRMIAKDSKAYSPTPVENRKAKKVVEVSQAVDGKIEKAGEIKPEKKVVKKNLPKKRVTIQLKNTDVSVVISALSKMVNQNVMMNAEENQINKISINVKNTPWDQVFNAVLKTRGLSYEWEGNIIRVMSLDDMQHDKQLEKVSLDRKTIEREHKEVEPLVTRIFYLDYADPDDVKKTLDKLLADGSRTVSRDGRTGNEIESQKVLGSVTVDKHNRAVIVKASTSDAEMMESLVERLDRPTKQVMIEAHIIETNKANAQKLGVQWGATKNTVGGLAGWAPNYSNLGNQQSVLNPTTMLGGVAANYPSGIDDTGMVVGMVFDNVAGMMLQAQLSALEEMNELKVLSSPSITTLDNQTAVVESGASVPFQAIDDRGRLVIKFEDALLKLEVTPHVIDEKNMRLDLLLTKNELDFTNPVKGYPTVLKKQTETSVVINNGQTTVIGGLTNEKTLKSEAGTPFLSRIPWLGYLFGSKGDSVEMSEVLIFITPHILEQMTASK